MLFRSLTAVRRVARAIRGLPRRAWLTVKYHGVGTALYRLVTFPLRLTPVGRRLGLPPIVQGSERHAYAWYSREWKPVTVVIPHYGPTETVEATVKSLRRTVNSSRVRIVVADDASPAEHRERLRRLRGVDLVLGEEQAGFAANCNRGIAAAGEQDDVVLLNNDVIAHEGWIESLQYAAYAADDVGVVGPKLLYPDGTIQSAGSHRNLGAPEWFDHRYRFKPAGHGAANVIAPVIATTGACMYVRRALIDAIGVLDESYGMAYEDVDYCLRTWEAGWRVIYYPGAVLTHLESKTRGMTQGERELSSQRQFWERWREWFEGRNVRGPDGRLRIIYVTEDTGVGGGHRVVFEHLNGLAARGHDAELWSLGGEPDWFELNVPVRRFDDYDELVEQLSPQEAIKVATWWNTAAPVWRGSVLKGVPVYFVQDIETSYYPGQREMQAHVMASYRQEFRFLTTSGWNAERLRELGLEPTIVAPGVALETFHPLDRPREERVVLALGRTQPLKNLDLTLEAYAALPEPRPELWLFGIEPEVGERVAARYFNSPGDAEVNVLYNRATVFVQTSRHEGFCLPLLEAMAAGAPVVCTDADGNRDFCDDGVNCLMVESAPAAVADGIARLLGDPELRARLGEGGARTARRYAWDGRIEELERFFESIAVERVAA